MYLLDKFVVEQAGKGFCHNDTFTCFGDGNNGIPGLLATLFQRKKSAPSGIPYLKTHEM